MLWKRLTKNKLLEKITQKPQTLEPVNVSLAGNKGNGMALSHMVRNWEFLVECIPWQFMSSSNLFHQKSN